MMGHAVTIATASHAVTSWSVHSMAYWMMAAMMTPART